MIRENSEFFFIELRLIKEKKNYYEKKCLKDKKRGIKIKKQNFEKKKILGNLLKERCIE